MNNELLTRRQIKKNAKARLRQPGVWGQMMVANLLPWLITVVFTLITIWGTVAIISNFGFARASSDPVAFASYYNQHADTTSGPLKVLIMLWFTQGIAFTALDVYRGETTKVRPFKAVMRLFNAQYFFGILAIGILVTLLEIIGFSLFIIPGILFLFGFTMSYYAYYDGKRASETGHFGTFAAMRASWQVMQGFKLDYFVLQLSLLGWFILKALTWHLFDFMIDPYLQAVDAGFYDNVKTFRERQGQ